MDEMVSGEELDHLEKAASLGYLLNALSHELNNHLTNLLLGADQARMSGESVVVDLMVKQAQKAGDVVSILQKLGQDTVSRGNDRIDLGELCGELARWLRVCTGSSEPEVLVSGDSVEVMADRQNVLRALCNLARVGTDCTQQALQVKVGVEQAPRSVWAPQGEEISMAVIRLRRGDPPPELNPGFKEVVDDFFCSERSGEEVRLMAAWEVVRKLRGRLQMYGGRPGEGLEFVLLLPLAAEA